mmetsp:Transcript_28777/g.43936  ORF Transcript_28777/g.43936 Transcript_28777/m.43936 type:complete len:437 (-) Transcript_28777:579-1889(-)
MNYVLQPRLLLIGYLSTFGLLVTESFFPVPSPKTFQCTKEISNGLFSTADPQQSNFMIEGESNFWHSVRRKQQPLPAGMTPSYNNLDESGPLPDDCYYQVGCKEYEPKSSCRVATDLKNMSEKDDILRYMHQCIEYGLTTFYGGSPTVYSELIRETPQTVLNRCNLVTSVAIPPLVSNPRKLLLLPLSETGGSCIDTLQLDSNSGSPYVMDMLDAATDLKREGLVRSIISCGFSSKLLREAYNSGFQVESNQIPVNLLDPCYFYNSEALLTAKDTDSELIVENPLAGGLLANKYWNRPGEPYKYELSRSEKGNLSSLYKWSSRHNKRKPWAVFQSDMIDILYNLSIKYQVSVEVVALRWALQLDNVPGIVVPADFGSTDDVLYSQIGKLRQVFKLNLEHNDIERLWEAGGCEKPSLEMTEFDIEKCEQQESGLFLP